MKDSDAQALVQVLADAFRAKLEPGTQTIYVDYLKDLGSTELAFDAVSEIIATSERFPTIAGIRALYKNKVAKAMEQAEGQERRALEAETVRDGDGLPVQVVQLLTKMQNASTDVRPDQVLVTGEPGACDDCGKPTEHRFVYGMFQLCTLCASKRLAARTKAE